MHGGGRGRLADRGRGAILASVALRWFPAYSSSDRDAPGGLFPVVALLEDFPLPDANSVCLLPW